MNKNWFSKDGKKFHLIGDSRSSGPQIISLCKTTEWCIPYWCLWVDKSYFERYKQKRKYAKQQCQECAKLEPIDEE